MALLKGYLGQNIYFQKQANFTAENNGRDWVKAKDEGGGGWVWKQIFKYSTIILLTSVCIKREGIMACYQSVVLKN